MLRLFAAVLTTWVALSLQPALAQDRLFEPKRGDYGDFAGQPMWLLAARCAAFNDTWREYAALADLPDKTLAEEEEMAREEFAPRRAELTEFGILRLQRDRPGQDAEAIFEAQVERELAAYRAVDRTYPQVREYRRACIGYLSAIEWVLIRMKRGWADQPGLG